MAVTFGCSIRFTLLALGVAVRELRVRRTPDCAHTPTELEVASR
ncbi:MAG: hypothetical protein ACXVXD_13525 [Nocardioidaceae bacterium]